MNYYEELGIRPDADEEEIRKAHRRLVKLMHPDQHRDQGLKALAETQMRRLNSIVATLLDPEERQEYDEQLRGESEAAAHGSRQSNWRAVPWWIASTLGAIVLTVLAVWLWADHMGSRIGGRATVIDSSGGVAQQPKDEPDVVRVPMGNGTSPETSKTPEQSAVDQESSTPKPPIQEKPKQEVAGPVTFPPPPAAKETVAPPPPSKPVPPPVVANLPKSPDVQPKPVQSIPVQPKPVQTKPIQAAAKTQIAHDTRPAVQMPAVTAPKIDGKKKLGEIPLVAGVNVPRNQLDRRLQPPGATGVVPGDDYQPPVPKAPEYKASLDGMHDPLEGEWVYAPTEPEKRKPGLYPPEFIKLRLIKQSDGMHGVYNARYDVADKRPISPEVSFELKSVDKDSRKYVWTSADGRHGTFEIRMLETDIMRLEWRTTGGRSGPALTSGIATLVRKN